jgi:hypothetical protein
MSNVTISIEMRIDAGSEDEARRYAVEHGIDVTFAKWQWNCDGKSGRLYAVASSPLSVAPRRKRLTDSGVNHDAGNL